jgi:hypothetical protein
LGLIFLSTKPIKKLNQRLTYGLGNLGFIGFVLFKLLFTLPHVIPSTPTDLRIINKGFYKTLYYIGDFKGQDKVFWKEHVIGKAKDRSFDLESSVADGLVVATKLEGDWYVTTVEMSWDNVSTLMLDKRQFQKDVNSEIEQVIEDYKWTEVGNYMSNLLTLIFVIVLIGRIIIYGP